MSRRVSRGVRARTASVSWPVHLPASGPTATAPTMTLSFVPAASSKARRPRTEKLRTSILCTAVTTWSPQAVSTDATCGSLNTAAGTTQ